MCYIVFVTSVRQNGKEETQVRVLLKPGVLDEVQKDLSMTDQDFSEHLGVSRSQLWRAKLPPDDKRFSLGQDFIAKTLTKLKMPFDEVFFLDSMSHMCDGEQSATKEIV
jgi:hypothetical protein